MAPDPRTGLLTTTFTLYFGMGSTSRDDVAGLRDDLISEGPLGVVKIQDPIETLPVSHDIIMTSSYIKMVWEGNGA